MKVSTLIINQPASVSTSFLGEGSKPDNSVGSQVMRISNSSESLPSQTNDLVEVLLTPLILNLVANGYAVYNEYPNIRKILCDIILVP